VLFIILINIGKSIQLIAVLLILIVKIEIIRHIKQSRCM